MGMIYDDGADDPIQIEDRTLAHLEVVIVTKLRRDESFTLSWQHPDGDAPGRTTIWLHPSIPLRFIFDDPESFPLRSEGIAAMATAPTAPAASPSYRRICSRPSSSGSRRMRDHEVNPFRVPALSI